MAAVTQLETLIPVVSYAGPDYGALSVQGGLKARGYYANVTPQVAAHKLRVVLKKNSTVVGKGGAFVLIPFDDGVAKQDIVNVAEAFGTKFAAFKDWAVSTTTAAAETAHDLRPDVVANTAVDFWEKKADEAATKGWFATLGIPPWMSWVVGGIVGLYVINSLVAAKKTFLGSTPDRGFRSLRGSAGEGNGQYIETYKGQRIYLSRDRTHYSTPLLRDNFTNLTNMRRAIARGVPAHLKPTSDA